MDEVITALVNTTTNEFIDDGRNVGESAEYVRVRVPRNPDPANERFSGDTLNPIRPVTTKERRAAKVDRAATHTAAYAAENKILIVWLARLHNMSYDDALKQLQDVTAFLQQDS